MCTFNKNVALMFGIKEAIIAQFIWSSIYEKEGEQTQYRMVHNDVIWCRCSMLVMTSYFPFYSRHQIGDAINSLIDSNIIRRSRFNVSAFDKTNWYTFTEYGKRIMTDEGDANEKGL